MNPPASHVPSCAATKVIGRMGSRSGLLWSAGDEASCSCDAGRFLADIAQMEERLADLEAGFKAMVTCDDCHHIFADNDGYQQHLCQGR